MIITSEERIEPIAGASEKRCLGRRRGGLERFESLVRNGIERAARGVLVEALHFSAIERAGAASAEDGELVAGFIDGTITIDAFGNG